MSEAMANETYRAFNFPHHVTTYLSLYYAARYTTVREPHIAVLGLVLAPCVLGWVKYISTQYPLGPLPIGLQLAHQPQLIIRIEYNTV